jgi:hypothetical protein
MGAEAIIMPSPLIPPRLHIERLTSGTRASHAGAFATRDHAIIEDWAARRGAEPATGESTSTGPATIDVNDGGAGIRFNFPGVARFRPIGWPEWFDNFDRHELMFVFDEVEGRPLSTRFRFVKANDTCLPLARSGDR